MVTRSDVFRNRVVGRASSLHNCVETAVIISCVINCPNGAVRFQDTVGPLDLVAIPMLPLAREVPCVLILHTVVEVVPGISLRIQTSEQTLRISTSCYQNKFMLNPTLRI